jgi:hypothetical protein
MQALLAVADRALFSAKDMGRNQILAAGFRSNWVETARARPVQEREST